MVGDVYIEDNVHVGLSNTIISPVTVGANTIMVQNIVLSGLNHGYADPDIPIKNQKETTAPIVIEEDCWIGDNAVVGGNRAKILKQYNSETKKWEKLV